VQVYVHDIAHGERVDNPADSVGPSTIATFVPKDRACRRWKSSLVQQMESVATTSLSDAKVVIEDWWRKYNGARPKKSLGGLTPETSDRKLAEKALH
jgi:hypothetical protein